MNDQLTSMVELIKFDKLSRFNPLGTLTPERLTNFITQFRAGTFRDLALVIDRQEETDDTLIVVIPKAKAAVTRHGWEVLTVDIPKTDTERLALAERQKECFHYFYNNLRASSITDLDELGGMRLLLKQMMDAKSKRYSVHYIVWKPSPNGFYTAELYHVPLWFFEGRTGRLRFIRTPLGYDGEDMAPGEWMVTVGLGLGIASAVAWMFKHMPIQDWLIYCSRHAMPGIEGVTDAAPGSAAWNQMLDAVRSAGKEFLWVRGPEQQINKIDFSAQGELPYPKFVERMDRALAAIWRGGDLSTMSKDGQAVGSNSQNEESDMLEQDDAAWLTETLNMKLERQLLDMVFGEGTEQLAYVKILTANKQNTDQDLKVDQFALDAGFPISKKQFSERYARPLPDEDDDLLTAPKTPVPVPATNERPAVQSFMRTAAAQLNDSLVRDSKPVIDRLQAVLDGPDSNFETGIKAILGELPDLTKSILNGDQVLSTWRKILGASLATGLTDETPKGPKS